MTEAAANQHGQSLDRLCTEIKKYRHMIVATNRGPVSFRTVGDGVISPTASGGMAVAALDPLANRLPLTWLALASNDADLSAVNERPGGIFSGPPVPGEWVVRFAAASRRVAHRHNNLVCNPLLWFLHHRTWGPSHTPNIDELAVDAWDNGHVPVTLAYLAEIEAEAKRVAKPLLLNTRDFTLPLLPGLVRSSLPDSLILHSSDVPWPGPDWWLLFPRSWRESIFRSLLSCDAITFPSERDRRAFAACAVEFVPSTMRLDEDRISIGSHEVVLGVAQAGVGVESLLEFARSPRVDSELRRLDAPANVHSFVSVDRAEPHSNIVRSIRAFGRMLEQSGVPVASVRYVLILAPPPAHLGHYRRYVDEIRSEATAVNRKYGDTGWQPVQLHLEHNYPKAVAALVSYDTLISVPLSDGSAGAVADGAIVNRAGGDVILSETSPAVELFGGAGVIVSPTDIEGMAAAMSDAIRDTPSSRSGLSEVLREAASRWTKEAALVSQLWTINDLLQRRR